MSSPLLKSNYIEFLLTEGLLPKHSQIQNLAFKTMSGHKCQNINCSKYSNIITFENTKSGQVIEKLLVTAHIVLTGK